MEITFARGDILRKVLERTGITAGRPLNLRRGGQDASSAAALLRKFRGFSQNAAMLSAKLDDLVEFAYPEAVMKSVWNKLKKPSRKTFGKILRRHDPRSPIPTMVFRDQAHMLSAKLDDLIELAIAAPKAMGASLATGGPAYGNVMEKLLAAKKGINPGIARPVGGAASMATGAPAARAAAAASPDAAKKVAQQAGQAVAEQGKAGAPGTIPPWSKFAGFGAGAATGVAAQSLPPRQQELSERLDKLIEFADPRPRNPLGEFSPQDSGGPSPNAMATVYKMPQQEQGVGRTAATLLTGGALGAVGASAGKHGYEQAVKIVKSLAAKRKAKL